MLSLPATHAHMIVEVKGGMSIARVVLAFVGSNSVRAINKLLQRLSRHSSRLP
jgi:hypothetical protein